MLGTVADDSGRFKLDGLPVAQDTITIRRVGYEPLTFTVEVLAASTVWLAVKMVPLLPVLETVTIAGAANDLDPGLAKTGFMERMRTAPGHFITPAEVSARHPSTSATSCRDSPLSLSRVRALLCQFA